MYKNDKYRERERNKQWNFFLSKSFTKNIIPQIYHARTRSYNVHTQRYYQRYTHLTIVQNISIYIAFSYNKIFVEHCVCTPYTSHMRKKEKPSFTFDIALAIRMTRYFFSLFLSSFSLILMCYLCHLLFALMKNEYKKAEYELEHKVLCSILKLGQA